MTKNKYKLPDPERPLELLTRLSPENFKKLWDHCYFSVDHFLGLIEVDPKLVRDWLDLSERDFIKLVFEASSLMSPEQLKELADWEAPERGLGLYIGDEDDSGS